MESDADFTMMDGIRKVVVVRVLQRVDQMFTLKMTAYNLTRMRTLGKIRLQGQEKDKKGDKSDSGHQP